MQSLSSSQPTTELERLLIALSAKTHAQAASLLEVSQSCLSDCKRRGSVVTGKLLEQAIKIDISISWIKDGQLPMRLGEAAPKKQKCAVESYCLEVCPALEAVKTAVSLIAVCPHICKACNHKK